MNITSRASHQDWWSGASVVTCGRSFEHGADARAPRCLLCRSGARGWIVRQRGDLPGAPGHVGGFATLRLSVVWDARSASGTTCPWCPGCSCRGRCRHCHEPISARYPARRAGVRSARSPGPRLASATTGPSRPSWSSSPACWRSRSSTSSACILPKAIVWPLSVAVAALLVHGGGGDGGVARPSRGCHLRRGLVRRVLRDVRRQPAAARLR